MKKTMLKILTALALLSVTMMTAPSLAADVTVDLAAVAASWTPPGGAQPISMWGFILDPGSCPADTPAWNLAPRISAVAGDNLTINLRNCLAEAVSIFIPGQGKAMAPVYDGNRMTSLAAVAGGNGGTATYTWNNLKAGTSLYHSGTHLAKQVQMGLYGALIVDAAAATATDPAQAYPGSAYGNEVVLFYSEIDPALHDPPAASTPNAYSPRYFLVNGHPYVDGETLPIPAGVVNQTTLVRMLSACLDDVVPAINGTHWSLIAEDGNPYIHPKRQYSALLSAMKTLDAMLMPTAGGIYPVIDRRLNLTNNGAPAPGGMLALLEVGSGAVIASNDMATTNQDVAVIIEVLSNDTTGTSPATAVESVTVPANGTAVLNPDQTITYTPNPGFTGSDAFTYRASDGTDLSNWATVTVTVNDVADAPLANNDAFEVQEGSTLTVLPPGVLENDSDPDGDTLTAMLGTNVTGGALTLNANGSFNYTPNAGTVSDSFTYVANDGVSSSAPATVTITVTPAPANQPPVANPDFATTTRNTAKTIDLMANDTDPDGNLNPTSVSVGTVSSRGGTITNLNNGSVVYTPKRNFRGTDTFSYTVSDSGTPPLTSNSATVQVNVVR